MTRRMRWRSPACQPTRLELEITESLLLRTRTATCATLQALRETGVRIAHGRLRHRLLLTGYLRRFPFDKIKIDQSS